MLSARNLQCARSNAVSAGIRSSFAGQRMSTHVSNGMRVRAFFNFNKKESLRTSSKDAGMYGSQARDEFDADDVEQYFNYMGMLATEGTYDRLTKTIESGLHPVDILLLWASQENDDPKVEELLKAGADFTVKDLDGKTPLQLATDEIVIKLLTDAGAKE